MNHHYKDYMNRTIISRTKLMFKYLKNQNVQNEHEDYLLLIKLWNFFLLILATL